MAYPYCFKYKGKRWNLVDLRRPEDKDTPYIILESLNSEKNTSRTIHTVVIKTDKRVFQLGRGHDSDLRINDISVSRRHASLEYRDDGFYIVDYQSKFGTLVLLSHNIVVPEQTHQTVQIGRTIVTTKAKIRSKVPEFPTSGGHIISKNGMNVKNRNEDYGFEGYKLDPNTKVIEIDGKRYLVRPEIEDDDMDNNCKRCY